MTGLTAALERLDRAIERLDAAAGRKLSAGRKLAGDLAREREERREAEIVAEGVASRLDGAIERIRSVLEG